MSVLEQVKDILLRHKGRANRITSAQIANLLGIIEDDTHAGTRAIILETAEIYGLPLAADSGGYYIIETQEEYDSYMNNLDSRQKGIERRKEIITKNYKGE